MNKTAGLSPYWIRRAIFYYLFFIILSTQILFVLSKLGIHLTILSGFILLPAVMPITMASIALWREYRSNPEPQCRVDPKIWGLIGPVMFVLWALGYFLSGQMVDVDRLRVFNSIFDRVIPFDFHWVFLYLSVYPMFLLPYFYVRRGRSLITLSAGYFIMLSISYTIFLVLPVAYYHRPVLENTDFAAWCMNAVYGQDPLWNCLPSTHCGVAILSAIAMIRDNRRLGGWVLVTALLIGVSTLFTKQHYIVDVLAGYSLGVIVYWSFYSLVEPKMPKKIPMPEGTTLKDVDIS